MSFAEQLSRSGNPFGPAPTSIAPPVRVALDAVMRSIAAGSPLIVVTGPAGSGKTLVLNLVERALRDEGQVVQRLEPGEKLEQASGILLVDNAESADQAMLQNLLSPGEDKPAATVVLASRPSFATRFGAIAGASFVKLTSLPQASAKSPEPLSPSDPGPPDLVTPEPLNEPVVAAKSPPPPSRPARGLGVVVAASDRIAQIGLDHVTDSIRIDPIPSTREESRDTQVAQAENVVAAHKPPPPWVSDMPAAQPKTAHAWRSYRPLAAALVIAAVVIPLLLVGTPHATTPLGAKAVSESRGLIAARSKIDPLMAMEKVAIDLRRPAILAVIAPSPLRVLPIAREERGARKTLQTAAKEEKISGKSAVVAGSGALVPIPVPLPKPAAAARARPEAKTVTAAAQKPPAPDNSKRTSVAQDKAPAPARAVPPSNNQPASSVAAPPSVKVAEDGIDGAATLLSHDQVARLLRDLSQRVGFAPAEYSALQACVFGKVGQGSVEANVFRSLVRRCVL